jgi:hypothetical protein
MGRTEGPVFYLLISVLTDPVQKFISLRGRRDYGITWLVWSGLAVLGPAWQQTHSRMQFLEVSLSAFRPYLVVSPSVGERRLWKLIGKAWAWVPQTDLQQTMLGCSFWRLTLVISDSAKQFTSMVGVGGCGNQVIEKTWALGPQTLLTANTYQVAVPRGGP